MVGEQVGHYKIVTKLGEGGMGEVFLADDTKLPRQVVLKFLPKELRADAVANQRFQFEAQAIASLNHPNIITIHETGEYSGRSYFVMEHVDGGSLRERISGIKDIPDVARRIKEIIIIGIQICRGLKKAHQAKIIHRDIKPANILLNTDGQVKLTDFGLAKLIGTDKLTKDKYAMGTGHYMSPEQISGEDIDHRTDIWSLGVVLYECLTGELPFRGDYIESLFYSILNEEPKLISESYPAVTPELDRIIRKCLEKSVDKRYGTVADLLSDLTRLKEEMDSGEKTAAERKGRKQRTRSKWVGKCKVPALIAALIVLVILTPNPLGETIKGWVGSIKIPQKKFLIVLPLANPGNDPEKNAYCIGTTERIINRINNLELFHPYLWATPSYQLHKQKVDTVEKACTSFAITLVISGYIKFQKSTIIHTLNLWEAKSMKKLKTIVLSYSTRNLSGLQVELFVKIAEMLDLSLKNQSLSMLKTMGTANPGAYKFFIEGLGYLKGNEKDRDTDTAIARFNRAAQLDNAYIEAFQGLSEAYLQKYSETKEDAWAEKSIASCHRTLQMDNNFWPAFRTLGMVYEERGQYELAVSNFQRAARLNQKDFTTLSELGWVYFLSKKMKKAEEILNRAIQIRPDYWAGYEPLAYFYFIAGRTPEALKTYNRVIDLNPVNMNAYHCLMGIYIQTENHQSVADIFKRAIRHGPDHKIYSNMGTSLFYQQRFGEAQAMYEKAIELGADDRRTWGNLADSYRYVQGYEKQARAALKTAINLTNKELESKPNNGQLLSSLALYRAKIGEHDRAIIEIEKALQLAPNSLGIIRNSIVVFELSMERDKAMQSLKEFIDRMGQPGELNNHPDLISLRRDPRYGELLKGQGSTDVKKRRTINKEIKN